VELELRQFDQTQRSNTRAGLACARMRAMRAEHHLDDGSARMASGVAASRQLA